MKKALMCWSGGKDSATALYEIQKAGEYEVVALVTTVTEGYDRISMHGVRNELLEQQSQAIGLPLEKVIIARQSSNEEYEVKMKTLLETYAKEGVCDVIFGDIFLEDLKEYRNNNLAKVGMTGVYPIWERDTRELGEAFIDAGFKTILVCVDTNSLDGSFAGRMYDTALLRDLPDSVDPCGENGEFHSFCFDGPIFAAPINIQKGEIVLRDNRFMYCDVLPCDKISC